LTARGDADVDDVDDAAELGELLIDAASAR
jgi:hypothetical protein